jgi:hypothetical protein
MIKLDFNIHLYQLDSSFLVLKNFQIKQMKQFWGEYLNLTGSWLWE